MKEIHKKLLFTFVYISLIPLLGWLLFNNKDQDIAILLCSMFTAQMWIDNWSGYSFAKLAFTALVFPFFVTIICLTGTVLLPKLILGHSLITDIWAGLIIGYFPALFITLFGGMVRRKPSKTTNNQ